MSKKQADGGGNAGNAGTALAVQSPAPAQPGQFLAVLKDSSQVVLDLGRAFYESGMFGCKSQASGIVLAMHCATTGKSPVDIAKSHHFIGGNLTLKADAMLASFRADFGGDHVVCERTPDAAEVELIYKGRSQRFRFTWEEAKGEDYVYTKDANSGRVSKDRIEALKENWSTPRRRMQMLWARVVSDGIRAVEPAVNYGQYTPEELDGEPEPSPNDRAVVPQSVAAEVVAEKRSSMPATERAAVRPASPAPPAPPAVATVSTATDAAPQPSQRQSKIDWILAAKDKLGITAEQFAKGVEKRGGKTIEDVPDDGLDDLIGALGRRLDAAKVKAGVDEQSQWAAGQLQPAAEATAKPAGNE